MKIIGQETILLRDILIGEVWIASGQSNMEMPIGEWGRVTNYEQEISKADYPNIRLFQVPKRFAFEPEKSLPGGEWKVCSPEAVSGFSAAAYFFGRELYKELNKDPLPMKQPEPRQQDNSRMEQNQETKSNDGSDQINDQQDHMDTED